MYPQKTNKYNYTDNFDLNEVYSFLNGVKPVLCLESAMMYQLSIKDRKAFDELKTYPYLDDTFALDCSFYFQNKDLKEKHKNLNSYSVKDFGLMFGYPKLAISHFIEYRFLTKEVLRNHNANKLLVCLNGTVFISYSNILAFDLNELINQKIITEDSFDLRIFVIETNDILVFNGKEDLQNIFKLLPNKLDFILYQEQ